MPRINDLDRDIKSIVSYLDLPAEELPGKMSASDHDDQKITRFYAKYRFWMFDFAKLLVESNDESVRINSGFAVLNILNSYVDAIGKLCGNSKAYNDWDNKNGGEPPPKVRIKVGLEFIFSELVNHSDREQVAELFYANYRNGIAHAGFPNRVFLGHDLEHPLAWGNLGDKFILLVNPTLFYNHLRQHFDGYVFQLRYPNNQGDLLLRELFLKRVDKIR